MVRIGQQIPTPRYLPKIGSAIDRSPRSPPEARALNMPARVIHLLFGIPGRPIEPANVPFGFYDAIGTQGAADD
jgi:hypothetical protein